jgi:hypothetical protein
MKLKKLDDALNESPDDNLELLTPLELDIVTALVYERDLSIALAKTDMSNADWDNYPAERKELVIKIFKECRLDMAKASLSVMRGLTLKSAQVMSQLLDEGDNKTKRMIAQWLLEHAHGKPSSSLDINVEYTEVKGYMVVSPDDWDEDDDIPELPDGDIIEGEYEND